MPAMSNKICEVIFICVIYLTQQLDASVLPKNLKPLSYELAILTHVDENRPTFEGIVTIKMKCVTITDQIILNQNALTIHKDKAEVWSLTDEGKHDSSYIIKKQDPENNRNRYVITLENSMKEGTIYKVVLHYAKYYMLQAPVGYAYITYKDKSLHSDIEYMTYTNMNTVDAMRVFPCVDELDVKATFKIELGHPPKIKSFSNSQFASSRDIDDPPGWVMDTFLEIKNPISTFSVALAVVHFKSIDYTVQAIGSTEEKLNVEIRVSAENDVLPQMNEVLRVASESFSYFSEFLNAPYELGKLDLIVLPKGQKDVLGYYGMIYLEENDSKNSFRELDTYSSDKYSMVSRICHATCQQWIGHSVTMSLWSETWLHVGLNTFFEIPCFNTIYPSWKEYSQANVIQSFLELLKTEERGTFNPIVPLESNPIFTWKPENKETLSKVHHIIRMLSQIMESGKDDEPLFQNSVRNYLKEFRWKNSSLNDVWKSFTKTAEKVLPEGMTVEKIMNNWLTQLGHPLLYVSRNENTDEVIVKQEPFEATNEGKKKDNVEKCWIMPLSFRTQNEIGLEKLEIKKWFKCDKEPLQVDINTSIKVQKPNWVVFNSNLQVPLRVDYAPDLWVSIQLLLLEPMTYKNIDYLTRIQLVSDMFALAEVGRMSYKIVFKTMKYLIHEENYQCWNAAYNELAKLRTRWMGTKLFGPLEKYMDAIVRPILNKKIGDIGEFLAKNERRSNPFERVIIKAACTFENTDCMLFSIIHFRSWYKTAYRQSKNSISEDLSGTVFCAAMKVGQIQDWEILKKHYTQTSSDDSMLKALACFDDTEILNRFLEWGTHFKSNEVSPEFYLKIFSSLLANKLGYPIVKEYLTLDRVNNLRSILIAQPKPTVTIEDILAEVFKATKSTKDLEELIQLSNSVRKSEGDNEDILEESKIAAGKNIRWLEKEQENMAEYLKTLGQLQSYEIAEV